MSGRHFFNLFILLAAFNSAVSFAKNINLYDQPKADAKVVGKIDTDAGIIPIFTPKDSTWIKVGNPTNGDVGWIKNSDLGDSATTGFTFTQHMISTGKGPGTSYQVFQFGNPQQQMTSEQAQAIIKKAQAHQQAIQEDTKRIMQDMFKNMGQGMLTVPFIMPVIIVPQQNTPAPAPQKK